MDFRSQEVDKAFFGTVKAIALFCFAYTESLFNHSCWKNIMIEA